MTHFLVRLLAVRAEDHTKQPLYSRDYPPGKAC
jgi:hypothetical protein